MFIKKLEEVLQQFPQDWDSKKIKIFNKENAGNFISDFYININFSILTGEYIKETASLSKVSEKLWKIIIKGEGAQDALEYRKALEILYHFDSCITQYEELPRVVKNIFDESTPTIRVPNASAMSHLQEGATVELVKSTQYELIAQNILFQINLRIALIDHSLCASVDQINDLVKYISQATFYNDGTSYPFIPYILDKAYFLLKKISQVFGHHGKYFNVFDEFDKNTDDINSYKVKFYDSFLEKSNMFSPSDDITEVAKSKINDIEKKIRNSENLKFIEFKLLLRFVSLGKRSTPSHDNIIAKFVDSKKYLSLKDANFFDQAAYRICYLYMKNNFFSFLIKKNNSYDKIYNLYSNIITEQEGTTSVSYFTDFKYSKYLMGLIESLMKESNSDSGSKIEKLFSELKEVSKRLEFMFFLSQDKKIIPFQAPFDECLHKVKYEGEYIDLFLSSSYCFPLDFASIKKDVDQTINQIELIRLKLDLSTNFKDVQDKISEANNQIQNSNKTQVEILSIFAAIVLFVASNIQLFPKFKTLKQALLFTITEAFSLGLFVMLIWFVTRGNIISELKRNVPWLHISLLFFFAIISAILVVLILFYSPDTML